MADPDFDSFPDAPQAAAAGPDFDSFPDAAPQQASQHPLLDAIDNANNQDLIEQARKHYAEHGGAANDGPGGLFRGAVAGLDWLGANVARPLAEKGYALNRGLPGTSPLSEYSSRALLAPILGDSLRTGQPEQDRLAAINKKEELFGTTPHTIPGVSGWPLNAGPVTNSDLVEEIPALVGQVPQMLLGLGWASKGAAAVKALSLEGKVLPKLIQLGVEALGSGAENAVLGTAQRAVKGEEQAPGTDLAIGAGMHLGGAVLGKIGEKLKNSYTISSVKVKIRDTYNKIGWLAGDALDRMADEVGFLKTETPNTDPLFTSQGIKDARQLEHSKMLEAARTNPEEGVKVRPGDLDPSAILLHRKPDGSVYASVNEIRVGQPRKFYEMPLDTLDDALQVGKLADSKKLGVGLGEAGTNMPLEMLERVMYRRWRPLLISENSLKGTKVELPARSILPSLDEPIPLRSPDSTISVREDGHMKVEPSPENALNVEAHPEPGDSVSVIGAGNQRSSGVLHGIDPVTHKATVDIRSPENPSAKLIEVNPDQVVRTNNQDVNLFRYGAEPKDLPPSQAAAGLHFSIYKAEPRYQRIGSNLRKAMAAGKNILEVTGGHPGVEALRQLAPQEYMKIGAMTFNELADYVDALVPGSLRNYGQKPSELMEILGALRAREQGFDAIVSKSANEFVALTDSSITSGPPPTGPEFPKKGESHRPPSKGDLAFIPNPQGGYLTVKVLGKGAKPNEVMVAIGPASRPFSIAASKVESRLPPGIQNLDQLQPVQPTPPPPDVLAHLQPDDVDEVIASQKMFENLSRKEPGLWDKTMKQLLGGQNRGAKVMKELHLRQQGSLALQKVRDDMYKAIESRLPKGLERQAFNRALEDVVQGRATWDQMRAKYGDQVDESLVKLSDNFVGTRQRLEADINALGGQLDDLIVERTAGNIEPYLVRTYMRDLLPQGEWAKRVQKSHPEVFSRAVEFLHKELSQDKSLYITPEQVSAELEQILKAPNIQEAARSSPLMENKAFRSMMSRKDIPEPIRAVMGEVTSASIRMASTLGNMESIKSSLQLFDQIAKDPALSSVGRRADLFPQPVPNVPRQFGHLAGRYVTPEVYNEIINIPNTVKNTYAIANQFQHFLKGNQLAGFGPWITSLMGNLQGSMLSGGLSLTRPMAMGKDLTTAIRAWGDYHADPTGLTGDGFLFKELKKLGAGFSGRSEVEAHSGSKKFVQELLKEIDGKAGFSAIGAIKKVGEKYQDVIGGFGHMLDTQDQFMRLANYIGLRRKFLAKGMNPEEAGLLASRRIADSFPNAEHLGPAIEKMRSMAGVFAPYITPKAEELRILSQLPRRLMEEKDLGLRIAAHIGIMGGVGAMIAHTSGITQDQMALAQESMTKRLQRYKTALLPLPFRDDLGRVQFIDMTNYFLPFQLAQGHPDDNIFKRIAYNFATLPFEGGLAQAPLDALAEKGGVKRPFPNSDLIEGEGTVRNLLDSAFKLGFAPQMVNKSLDMARKTQVGGTYDKPETLMGTMGRNEEQFTPGQAATNLAGIKVQGAGDKGFRGAAKERTGEELNLLRAQLPAVLKSTRPPEEKKRLVDAILARVKVLSTQQQHAQQVRGAVQGDGQ